MNTTIDLVSILVAVGDTASFSTAATRLGVTTGTISRGIARLESQVGTQLVHRTTRNVSLSTAGQALFERAAAHVRGIESALKNLPERHQEPAGTLRLTAPSDIGVTILPEVIARFVARYPEVRVDCDLSNRKVDLVREGFDLMLRGSDGRERDATLVGRRVLPVEARAYASPSYIARRGTPRVLGEAGHEWLGFTCIPKRRWPGMEREARVFSNDLLFLREATRAGVGVGLLANVIAEPLVADGSLVPVLPRARLPEGAIMLLYPKAEQLPRKVTAFRDVLLATLKRP